MADECNFGALTATGFVEHSIDRAKTYVETNALGPTTDISFRPHAKDPLPEDGLAHVGWIYLDPTNGNDANVGKTLATAVETLAGAFALLTVTETNIHIHNTPGGFVDLPILWTNAVVVLGDNLKRLQCQPATAANITLQFDSGAFPLDDRTPQLKCEQIDNIRLNVIQDPAGSIVVFEWTRAPLKFVATETVLPFEDPLSDIRFCEIISESYAVALSGQASLLMNSIFVSGITDRNINGTLPDIWGIGAGSGTTFDDRYTGCILVSQGSIRTHSEFSVFKGTSGSGSVYVFGDDSQSGGACRVELDNSTMYGFEAVFRVAQENFDLGEIGFPGPVSIFFSIVDNIGALSVFDPSLANVVGLGSPFASIINTSLNDPLLTISAAGNLTGIAARRWDSEDWRLQIAGIEYAPGLPFAVTSPAIDFDAFGVPTTIGAWVPLIYEAPYTGQIARFVEGFSPDLKLSANRTNYQSWHDILGNFHAVWDSTVWIVEFTLSSRYFTGTSHSVEWTKLLRGSGTKRLWPDGLQGVLSAVPQDFTAATVDINLGRPLDVDLYSGWVARVDTTTDDWAEPAGLELPAVTTWVGFWLLNDSFGLAVGNIDSATWNGLSWVAQGPGPGFGFDPVGDTGGRVLHGSSASNVWMVNDGGIIFRWVGEVWEVVASPAAVALRAVWTFSDNLAYAVGDNGTLIAWDGLAWTPIVIPGVGVGDDIYNVWGSNPGDLWITVTNHGVLHWDGVSWTDVTPTGAGATFRTIYGSSTTDVYAGIDQDLWHWDGDNWNIVHTLGNVAVWDQIWGDGKGLFWASAAGDDGVDATGALWHWDGISWAKEYPPTGTLSNRTKIYGTPSAVYALGGEIDLQVLKREIADSGHYLIESNTGSRFELSHLYGPDPLAEVATVLADLVSITILYLPVELNTGDMPMVSEFYVDGELTPWRKSSDESSPQEFHSRNLKLKQSAEVVY